MPYRLRLHRTPVSKPLKDGLKYEDLLVLRYSLTNLRNYCYNSKIGKTLFRDFFNRCLNYWAAPDTQMPDPDFFDMMNRVVNWKPSPAIKKFWKEKENG